MKFLIWFIFIFIASFIKVILLKSITLGGITTILFYAPFFCAASALCKVWEKHKLAKKDNKAATLFLDALSGAVENCATKGPIVFNNQRPTEPDYGISESNPLCSTSLSGTEQYLKRLRTQSGESFTWESIGGIRGDCNGATDIGLDRYQLYLHGEPFKVLYFVPYVGESTHAPAGMFLAEATEQLPTFKFFTSSEPENETSDPKPKQEPIPKNHSEPQPSRTRFCKYCGGVIDPESKKCTSCGKQFFRLPKLHVKKIITIAVILVLTFGVGIFFGFNYSNGAPLAAFSEKTAVVSEAPQSSTPSIAFSEDPTAISEASQSVAKLNCYDKNGGLHATGSGFACFGDNIIVTNYHVIEDGVYSIEASTEAGQTFDISYILATDEDKDIAILASAAPHNLPLLQQGNSDELQKGEKVVAIGSPLGLLNSVSTGVFSGYVYENGMNILQFTASISSGSSGGALFNDAGEVLGITFASYEAGQNLNLAIPIKQVEFLYNRITTAKMSITEFYETQTPTYNVDYVLAHYSELAGKSFYLEGWLSTSRYWKETNRDVYHAWLNCYNSPEEVLYPVGNDPLERVSEDAENAENFQCLVVNYTSYEYEPYLKGLHPGVKIRILVTGNISIVADRISIFISSFESKIEIIE